MITLDQSTKDRISTLFAPLPPSSSDTNIGKKATMNSGVYAGLEGIIYPKRDEILYEVLEDDAAFGHLMKAEEMYLLLFFYDDGTLFCGVPVDPSDVAFPGGYDKPVPGEGTLGSPYPCGDYDIASGYGSQVMYHALPPQAGRITIDFDMYGLGDMMNVYFANDPETLVASTHDFVRHAGQLVIYYDPEFNGNKVIVDMRGGGSGTAWEYKISCPKPVGE